MAIHDYVIANGSGSSVRSDLNDALAAIVSNNSNSDDPSDVTTVYSYQWWADTTANELKLRNGANNAWISFAKLDGNRLLQDGTVTAPSLAFADDVNTGIYSPANDQLAITTGGVQRVHFGATDTVFNEGGGDYNFRIEGDTLPVLFVADASTDRIGIGTGAPEQRLDVRGSVNFRANTSALIRLHNSTEEYCNIGNSGTVLTIDSKGTAAETKLLANGNELLRIKNGGTTRINGSSDATNFRINNLGNIKSKPTYNTTATLDNQRIKVTSDGEFKRITSSRRYKDNIVAVSDVGGLSVVMQLTPSEWTDHISREQVFGLIAEEVHEAGAELAIEWGPYNPNTPQNDSTPVTRDGSVAVEGDEVIEGISDRGLMIHLIQAIKDLKAENDALAARIAALEASAG